ncbi:MAG: ribose-5-phosphate isomerase RpiA [Planctomycetota bacterium]
MAAATAAAELAGSEMLVGLGTGRTASHAVRALADRVASGLRIATVATSRITQALAEGLGLGVVPLDGTASVDLTIDGADQVTPNLFAIKGGSGALLREKVIAEASDQVVVVVDSSKVVDQLGGVALPVEVLPIALAAVQRALGRFGVPVAQRMVAKQQPFLTDQGSFILDMYFDSLPDAPDVAARLADTPGVLEHGLFLRHIDSVFVGRGSTVEVLRRPKPVHGGES